MTELLDQLPDPRDLDQQLLRNIDLQLANITGDERYDAFGRLRVSETQILGDFKQVHNEHNSLLFIDVVSGTGTITHKANEALTELATGGTASGASAIRQTKKHFRYQPGKSQLIEMTGILGTGLPNTRCRLGFFSNDNGLYFEQLGGIINVVRRTKTSGSVVNNVVAQSDWSQDKMDGTGPSGVNLDFSKTQIFIIDFQWLGVGVARMGFSIDGKTVYAHEFKNSNVIDTVFMGTPTLPIRYEVENTGVASASITLKQICFSVSSEGGSQPVGVIRHVGNGTTTKTLDTTLRPMLSVRLKAAASRANISDVTVGMLATGKKDIHWVLSFNPIITGGTAASWTSVSDDSILEFDVARTGAISAGNEGHRIEGGLAVGSETLREAVLPEDSDIVLATSNLAATAMDELVLSAQTFSATDNLASMMTLRELT